VAYTDDFDTIDLQLKEFAADVIRDIRPFVKFVFVSYA